MLAYWGVAVDHDIGAALKGGEVLAAAGIGIVAALAIDEHARVVAGFAARARSAEKTSCRRR